MPRTQKPEVGQLIDINHRPVFSTNEGFNPATAEVLDLLDTQFTCLVEVDGSTRFCFYNDYDNSWRFK